jgi:hypothetical protein
MQRAQQKKINSEFARNQKDGQGAHAVTVFDTYCSTRRLRSLVS